jgi:hypothetical protein
MEGNSAAPRKAQLDKEEREHLEDIVTEMRERVEANVRYQLEEYDLEERPAEDASLSDEEEDLVEAIELEAVDDNEWDEGYGQYITGVGYTIVNRLAALRCMEVRNFIDDEVTRFREDGLTPAADRLVTEEFMLEEEAVLEAYRNACDDLAEEIEILFDRSTAYSLIDPDDDTYEDLCGMLDQVSDKVWRADDVLGWVYEYYNVKLLDDLRRKGDREGLEPEDVPAANQFYTPHWVVRMLTDNSLGKLYLEDQGELQDTVERQDSMSPDERKNRPLSPDEASDIANFCTYLVPSEQEGEPPEFDGPEDIRVIDPACGSGHFLLYAFDVLERIYRAETDLDHAEIPREILRNNLYGVDLDMRACQLAAFNLYLKGRTRAEAEGASGFDMPEVGIVCADAKVADVEGIEEVFEEVISNSSSVEGALSEEDVCEALESILGAFEDVHGLGSLLDVRGTIGEMFSDEEGGLQLTFEDDFSADYTLSSFLHTLQETISEHRDEDSFLAQDLRSFVRLLDVLAQNYDVALMNPPYGAQNRMPESVKAYVRDHYSYPPEYYINFFEVCNRLTATGGRIGMLVPRSFMFKRTFEEFRTDFLGDSGAFDYLAEFGIGVLDNATVRTVGTVIRSETQSEDDTGNFYRLYDLDAGRKESAFVHSLAEDDRDDELQRRFKVPLSELAAIPGSPICYATPSQVRTLHKSKLKLDPQRADVDGESIADAVQGLATGNNDRFVRKHWEVQDFERYPPIAKGGADAWVLPEVPETVDFVNEGERLQRVSGSRFQNTDYYGREGLTWTYIKDTGRRFGYYPADGVFSHTGFMLFPKEDDQSLWNLLGALNSDLYHALFLSITPERHWNVGEVGRIPWHKSIAEIDEIEEYAREQYLSLLSEQTLESTSPYYNATGLVPKTHPTSPFYNHPHQTKADREFDIQVHHPDPATSIIEATRSAEIARRKRKQRLERLAEKIDGKLFDQFEIPIEVRSDIRKEIFLRTTEDPEDREVPNPESIPEVPDNLGEQVKDLVHHFAMEAVREDDEGIIPLEGTDEQADMLDRIVERFEDAYGEYAEDRLVEVDDILGAESAGDEAYPNLRSFIEDDLFAYHVDTMENTPIVWKLSTERLLADAKGEGFACFVDYHQLDASLFDRLSNEYLEPRKAELRERRSAANQRRNGESLSTSERVDATEEFEFCSSALEQIAEFEEVMQELGSTNKRDFDDDDRERVRELSPKVATFREETAERIETLAELREMNGEEWFQDTFSDGFWEKVDEWRDEWLDALEELEYACEEYTKPSDEPVEAHLADLFDYFNWRLKGSDHYSSSGILFMTYYFDREGADLLNEDGEPFEKLAEDERMLASLATRVGDASIIDEEYLEWVADDGDVEDVDDLPPLAEFKALAEEIDDRCKSINKEIPSDWSERALSEITTAGYQPNRKHGVAINITPLAEKSIVPEVVEDKVL